MGRLANFFKSVIKISKKLIKVRAKRFVACGFDYSKPFFVLFVTIILKKRLAKDHKV